MDYLESYFGQLTVSRVRKTPEFEPKDNIYSHFNIAEIRTHLTKALGQQKLAIVSLSVSSIRHVEQLRRES